MNYEDVIEKLSQTITSVSLKSDYPFIGKFWGRNLEVLSSHFESYNFSLPAGKLIEAHLDDGQGDFDIEARRDIYVQQVLDQAFLVNQQALKNYMQRQLATGKPVSTRDMPIESAQDFLAVAHAIGLGAADGLSSEFTFLIDYDESPAREQGDVYFTKKDHFTFELVQKES